MIEPVSFYKDKLKVEIFRTAAEMGEVSAVFFAGVLKKTESLF